MRPLTRQSNQTLSQTLSLLESAKLEHRFAQFDGQTYLEFNLDTVEVQMCFISNEVAKVIVCDEQQQYNQYDEVSKYVITNFEELTKIKLIFNDKRVRLIDAVLYKLI